MAVRSSSLIHWQVFCELAIHTLVFSSSEKNFYLTEGNEQNKCKTSRNTFNMIAKQSENNVETDDTAAIFFPYNLTIDSVRFSFVFLRIFTMNLTCKIYAFKFWIFYGVSLMFYLRLSGNALNNFYFNNVTFILQLACSWLTTWDVLVVAFKSANDYIKCSGCSVSYQWTN